MDKIILKGHLEHAEDNGDGTYSIMYDCCDMDDELFGAVIIDRPISRLELSDLRMVGEWVKITLTKNATMGIPVKIFFDNIEDDEDAEDYSYAMTYLEPLVGAELDSLLDVMGIEGKRGLTLEDTLRMIAQHPAFRGR